MEIRAFNSPKRKLVTKKSLPNTEISFAETMANRWCVNESFQMPALSAISSSGQSLSRFDLKNWPIVGARIRHGLRISMLLMLNSTQGQTSDFARPSSSSEPLALSVPSQASALWAPCGCVSRHQHCRNQSCPKMGRHCSWVSYAEFEKLKLAHLPAARVLMQECHRQGSFTRGCAKRDQDVLARRA